MYFDIEYNGYDIGKTIESGQIFRYKKLGEEYYQVAVGKKACCIRHAGKLIQLWNCEEDSDEEEAFWTDYFQLEEDLFELGYRMSKDPFLKQVYEENKGLHILHQPGFEALISFIISQQKSIPQIKKCLDAICHVAGEYYWEEDIWTFPFPGELKDADLSECKLGYREPYIKEASKLVWGNDLDFSFLKIGSNTFEGARQQLMQVRGVGEKIANCVCLFGLHYTQAFPIDVHIQRMLDLPEMKNFRREDYHPWQGYVQQYLYNYALTHGI